MKNLYIIGGTMGVGKTAVSRELNRVLPNSVFLDGDWCWNADPFTVTDETKRMVVDNITHTLNNFIHCTAYKNIVFCWVMHEQKIIDDIIGKLKCNDCNIRIISLICNEENLRKRLKTDVDNGIRTEDIIERSINRLPLYEKLDTVKIDTSDKSIHEMCNLIRNMN